MSREGKLYVLILVLMLASALVNEINLLVLLFGLMLGPLVFSGFAAWQALRRVEVRRVGPAHAVAGEPFTVAIALINDKLFGVAWSVTVKDSVYGPEAGPSPRIHRPGIWFPQVGAGQTERARYRGVLTQRGRYHFSALRVFSRFPLGLVEASRVVEQADEMLVYPRMGRLTPQWAPRLWQGSTPQGRRRPQAAVIGSDYHSLRDFRPGDNSRWIHWRTSARTGKLMVLEFEENRRQDVAVLLDLWAPRGASDQESDRVELAVSFAASVCAALCRKGRSALTVVSGGDQADVVQGPASPPLLHQILCKLAVIESVGDSPQRLLERARSFPRARGSVVVISTRPAPESREASTGLGDNGHAAQVIAGWYYVDVGSPELANYYRWS